MSHLCFAVIGNPVNHSLSPLIHQRFAEQFSIRLEYSKIQGSERFLENQIQTFFHEGGSGLNITLPFKQQAFKLIKKPSERSQQAQSANTLWKEKAELQGDNTDGVGLIRDIGRYQNLKNKKILLLGAGGAAAGILPSLLAQTPHITIANRTMEKAHALQVLFPSVHCMDLQFLEGRFDIIINATSVGLTNQALDIPKIIFQQASLCYDLAYLIYGITPFVLSAREQGIQALDGVGMLVEQAAESFFIWTQLKAETESVKEYLRKKQLGFKKL